MTNTRQREKCAHETPTSFGSNGHKNHYIKLTYNTHKKRQIFKVQRSEERMYIVTGHKILFISCEALAPIISNRAIRPSCDTQLTVAPLACICGYSENI